MPTWSSSAKTLQHAILLGAAVVLSGCPAGRRLTVDLRSDLVPEIELHYVRIDVFEGAISEGEVPLRTAGAYPCCLDGREPARASAGTFRLAVLENLPEGTYTIRVVAHRPTTAGARPEEGEVLGQRRVATSISADRVVHVVLMSACAHVSCPGPSDAATSTECLNGRCVPPECDPGDPTTRALCGALSLCGSDTDCAAPPCAQAECDEGLCVASHRPGGCSEGYYCDRTAGTCERGGGPLPDAGPPDAGPPDAACAAETCTGGLDEDCDGDVDCADADCIGVACDDGDACTHTDVCTGVAGAACAGEAIACASSACMESSCNGTATCTEVPLAGPCADDGDPCTSDVCDTGACTHPPVPDNTPCPGAGGRCCGGTCVDTTSSPSHCGVCGITCPGICDLGACACTTNAQCQAAGYGSMATCATESRPNFCQCVCDPATSWRGECDECPGAARCAQISGLNPCIYP